MPAKMTLTIACFPKEVPTFDSVLNDRAPYPYSLKSFRDYVSQNHCSEPLEFLEELKRYKQRYRSALGLDSPRRPSRPSLTPQLLLTWRNILSVYILPGSSHELNLSSEERNSLLRYNDTSFPPAPCLIEEAVTRISQSFESSIFLPYLTSRALLLHTISSEDHLDEDNAGMIYDKLPLSTTGSDMTDSSSEIIGATTHMDEKSWRESKSVVFKRVLSFLAQPAKSFRAYQRSSRISSGNMDRRSTL
ncbi:hypothetical protein BDV27DRAFT_128296 [Aspergillus caelatus]|uniref:RGS domain-containing protein n=1 Tax=Aspergillus caelatus TaxID=61420 RepID=A0A5N7A3X0_9EURO|nr:uncharacterized protein BDV27DRAFT_128296 [Aspergillus caelatus]KAE8364522.1 hypothetical protein BDV27DRAFT_128296 [Aspergillus caelatus]